MSSCDLCFEKLCLENLSMSFFLFFKSSANEKLMAFAKYSYDALGQRIRLREFGVFSNKTFHLDVLLLFNQVTTTPVSGK